MARSSQYPPSVDPGPPIEPPLPSGWRRVQFADLLEVVERPVDLEDQREYQLVNAKRSRGGIAPRERLRGEQIRVKSQFRVEAGDFLISKRQIIHGACGVVPAELSGAVVSNEYVSLRPREGLELDFLRYLSSTPYFQRTCFHSSVGVDVEKMVFKLDKWLQFFVPIPPIREQRRIAELLLLVDETLQRSRAVVAELEVAKRCALRDLLTRGTRPDRKSVLLEQDWRLGRIAHTAEIPEGWELVRLVDVARLESGHTPSRRHPEYWNGSIPWVSLHDSKLLDVPEILDTAQHIGPLGLENSSARLLPKGTIVFSRTATVGKCTVLGREMATSQDFANYICGPRLHNRYLMHLLRWNTSEWERLMAGSTHQTIYMPVFKELQVLLPPQREQEEIAHAADAIDAGLAAEKASLESLSVAKGAVLADLLSGRRRFSHDKEAA